MRPTGSFSTTSSTVSSSTASVPQRSSSTSGSPHLGASVASLVSSDVDAAAERKGMGIVGRHSRSVFSAQGLRKSPAMWFVLGFPATPQGSRSWLIDGPFTGPPVTPQSIVSDLFRGTMRSRVRCRECHVESVTYEHFFDLSLTIPKYGAPFASCLPVTGLWAG